MQLAEPRRLETRTVEKFSASGSGVRDWFAWTFMDTNKNRAYAHKSI